MSAINFPLLAERKLLASIPGPSPREEEHIDWSNIHFNEGNLKSDLVVILAAMACALICALGLNSLLRCARCYSRRRMGGNSSDGMVIRLANTGLKQAAIKALPVIVYTSASKLPAGLATECPICLTEFGEGEKVRMLPDCNHGFHMECVDKWFTSHSCCPMCRHSLKLVSGNKKPEGRATAQATEANNVNVVIEIIPPRASIPGALPKGSIHIPHGSTTTASSCSTVANGQRHTTSVDCTK